MKGPKRARARAGKTRARRSRARGEGPPSLVLRRVDEIRAAAARLFREKGYHAATLREIAGVIGIEAPSLYNHFPSKQDLLTDILVTTMEELIGTVRRAVEAASADPEARLRAATIAYVRFHEQRFLEASISDTELRALEPKNLERVLSLRHEFGLVFKKIIREGVKSGAFRVDDPSVAAMAALSVCARLPYWYRPGERLALEQIAEHLADCVVRAVGGEVTERRRRAGKQALDR